MLELCVAALADRFAVDDFHAGGQFFCRDAGAAAALAGLVKVKRGGITRAAHIDRPQHGFFRMGERSKYGK